MARPARQATLYREDKTQDSPHVTKLTRGSTVKNPAPNLKSKHISALAGKFWVNKLPELIGHPEAYLEVNIVTKKGGDIKIPHAFKLQTKVRKRSFSPNIQGTEMISSAEVIGSGIEFQIRLTELDKLDEKKFAKIKGFIDSNDIPGLATNLMKSTLPFDPKEGIELLFNTVNLIDYLNDDDRVWIERPKLDLRPGVGNPLYEGWYAFVNTPEGGKATDLPLKLYAVNGTLYTDFKSDTDNKVYENSTYFSWEIREQI